MTTPPKGSPSPGPWFWDEDRRNLLSPNPDAEKFNYPPNPRYLPVLTLCEDHGWMADVADAALISKAPEMASMLRELAAFNNDDGLLQCPMCLTTWTHTDTDVAHAPDCRLSALLRELP